MIRYISFILFVGLSLPSCKTAKFKTPEKSAERELKHSEVPLSEEEDKKFIEFVSTWIGTPYLYGGRSMQGTDCSGLVFAAYKEVFGIEIPRSTSELYKQAKPVSEKELRTGDLVFFDIKNGSVSHVGMFLNTRHFIHSSTKKGVIISSLDETYYKEHFKSFGSFRKN